MKKLFLILLPLLVFNTVKSQNFILEDWTPTEGAIDYYIGFQNTRHLMYFTDTTNIDVRTLNFIIKSLDSTHNDGAPTFLTGLTNKGRLTRHSVSSLVLTKSQISDFSVTGTQVISGLGYTPYNGASNPNGYISGITSPQVISALGFTPLATEVDGSTNNEIQTLGLSGSTLSISSGNSVTLPSAPALSISNSPGRSIVTGTGATGFQVSSSRAAMVTYSATINTTISISGNATGYVVLEICATNSATAGDWVEISRTPSGQTGTIVVGLTLNQIGGGNISGVVPAGYYAKIRSVNTSGTPTYTYNCGQEVLFN